MKPLLYLRQGMVVFAALGLSIVVLNSCSGNRLVEEPLSIPHLGGEIYVDGSAADWAGKGLQVPVIADQFGETAPADFAASVRLAWDDSNFYLLAEVSDDSLMEVAGPLNGDGMEIFLSQERGSNRMVQYIVSPGITGDYPDPRVDRFDYLVNKPSSSVNDIEVASSVIGNGYIVELAIPWEHVGITAEAGSNWALNFYLGDVDPGEKKVAYSFYFNQDVWGNHHGLRQVELSEAGTEIVDNTVVKAWIEDRENCRFKVLGGSELSGEEIALRAGGKVVGSAGFEPIGDLTVASLDISRTSLNDKLTYLVLELPGGKVRELYFRDMANRYVNTEKPNRFEDDIVRFEEEDRLEKPPAGAAVFIGSSSIARWASNIGEDFKNYEVICRGFGGSTTGDALYYFDRIAVPYDPAVIVLAEGSNDLGRGDLPEEVVDLTEQFILRAADKLPDATVIVMSVKVSVSRKRLVETVMQTNALLQEMTARHDNAIYVDVVSEMLTPEGLPRPEIFVSDSTHMNPVGYEIWTRIMDPYLGEYGVKSTQQ